VPAISRHYPLVVHEDRKLHPTDRLGLGRFSGGSLQTSNKRYHPGP
jgi:hypothetical protein